MINGVLVVKVKLLCWRPLILMVNLSIEKCHVGRYLKHEIFHILVSLVHFHKLKNSISQIRLGVHTHPPAKIPTILVATFDGKHDEGKS